MRTAIILCALIITLCPRVSEGHSFTGRVERMIDGDTICVRAKGEGLKAEDRDRRGLVHVRLAEIDAPEMKTPHGPAAKQALSDMILGKIVRIEWKHRGRYRRIIGQVYLGEDWINRELVDGGNARRWPFSCNRALLLAETAARSRQLGVWASSTKVP